MESVVAAFLPALIVFAISRIRKLDASLRRALIIIPALTLAWFAPVWVTASTPVSFDLVTLVPPWSHLRPEGYVVKNLLLNDIPLQAMPWREGVRESVFRGDLPFLLRGSASGTPLWENLQSAPLFPLTWISLLFSPAGAGLFLAVSKTLVALAGMYLFLRSLALSHGAGLFGAIAYAFGGFSITFLLFAAGNVTSLLPLLCHALVLVARRTSWTSVAWTSTVLALMFFGGHPESVFHSAFVALPFAGALLVGSARRLRLSLQYLCVGVLALALAAPLLLPFLSWLPHTERAAAIERDSTFLSAPPFEASTFVPFLIPNYFGNPRIGIDKYRHAFNFNDMASQYAGLTTLILAACAALLAPRRHAFWSLLLAALVIITIPPSAVARALSHVPIFEMSAKPQMRLAVLFALATLGAHGFDAIRVQGRNASAAIALWLVTFGERSLDAIGVDGRKLAAAIALGFAALVAAIAIASSPVLSHHEIRRFIFFTELPALAGAAALAAALLFRPGWLPAIPALLFLDLFAVLGLYNPAVSTDFAYPETGAIRFMRSSPPPFRISGMEQVLLPNTAVPYGLEDIRPHDPVAFSRYMNFLRLGGLDTSTYFAKFSESPSPVLEDFLGVRFTITAPEAAGPAVYRGVDATVFENPEALPRFFVPSSVTVSARPIESFFANPDARAVFIARQRPAPVAAATLQLLEYTPRSASVEIVATAPTFVASSEVALPGWRLRREGTRWPIVRTNGIFVGWEAPAGRSVFTLSYLPRWIGMGVVVALSALAILIGMVIWERARRSREPEPAPGG